MTKNVIIEVPSHSFPGCAFELTCREILREELMDLYETDLKNLRTERDRLLREKEQYKRRFTSLLEAMSQLLKPDQSAMSFFREKMKKIPQVESVHAITREDGVIDVWIMIPENNYAVKKQIVKEQCFLMRIFQSIRFDFMILVKQGRELSEILPRGSIEVYAVDR